MCADVHCPQRISADGKKSACNVEDPGLTSGSGRSPGEENGNSLQYSCLGNPMKRRSLVGHSSWGLKRMIETRITSHAKEKQNLGD